MKGSVTVFCGSASGCDPAFVDMAREVGKQLAMRGLRLVYGGSKDGCMGAVADGALQHGGKVLGIVPSLLIPWEISHQGLSELRVTDDLPTRKQMLIEEGDLILVLPGGFGTLDEFFEVITLSALQQVSKATIVFNYKGFYDELLNWMEKVSLAGFARPSGNYFSIASHIEELKNFLDS